MALESARPKTPAPHELPANHVGTAEAATGKGGLAEEPGFIARARTFFRERGAAIGVEILINFVLPFFIYSYGEKPLGQVHALMAAAGPPFAWAIIEFARRRRLDALSLLVLAGIVLSLLVYMGGGSVRFLQLREKLVTASIGLVFLGSAAIGRPLIYQLGRATMQRRSSAELREFEAMKDDIHFRRAMTIMTVVWGAALMAEAAVSAVLVFCLSVRQYLLVGPVLGYATMGAVGLWSFFYTRRRRREGLARRASSAAGGDAACTKTTTH